MKKKAVASEKSTKATPADAQVLLQLYDLRREPTMREARNFMAAQFNPQSADDMVKLASAFGTQENAYFRQVTSYWDMAASLALHGAVHKELFESVAGEMYFYWAKMQPHIAKFRADYGSPTFMSNVEKLVEGSAYGRQRRINNQASQRRFTAQRAASEKQQAS